MSWRAQDIARGGGEDCTQSANQRTKLHQKRVFIAKCISLLCRKKRDFYFETKRTSDSCWIAAIVSDLMSSRALNTI